jgi:CheY-like chemotaxis protein
LGQQISVRSAIGINPSNYKLEMSQELNPSSKGSILVVDDTPANLNLLTEILSKQGYKVRLAPSGKLAIMSAQSSPPDLILLDIMMPELNGYEVCKELKSIFPN